MRSSRGACRRAGGWVAKAQVVGAAILSTSMFVAVARADGRASATAELLFRDGRRFAVAGDFKGACPRFAESLRLERAPGTLLNLADCEERLGQVASSWTHFRELSSEVAPGDERRAIAQGRAAALEGRVPHLTIRMRGGQGALRVECDGVEVAAASLGVPLAIDPGKHTIAAKEGDRVVYRTEVEVSERENRVLAGEADAGIGTAAPWGGGAPRAAGWILGGIGITALATGAAFGVAALVNNGRSSAGCAGGICDGAASAGAYDDARGEARVADVVLGIGIAATVVAGCLLLTSPERHADEPARTAVSLASGRVSW